MKRLLMVFAAFILFSTVLMAAGGRQGSGAQAATGGPVEIRARYWGEAKRFELYDKIIQEFEKVHTNVTVIREPSTWGEYWDKLNVQIAGGNAPDFLNMHPQYAADYLPKGVLEPLDKFIADGVLSLEGWAKSSIDTGMYNGVNYMLAMGNNFNGAIVNYTGFKALNVDPPEFEWSWDDTKRIGQQVRAAFDAQGRRNYWMLNDISNNILNFRYYNKAFGREVYDPNGNITCTQADVERWYAMFKEFRDLGIIPDAATATEFSRNTLEDSLVARDRVLIVWNPAAQLWHFTVTFPNKDLHLIRMAGSKGLPYPGEWPQGAHYGIYSRTTPEKKLASAQLMNFWLNDGRSLRLFGFDQGVPANTPLVNQVIVPTLDPPSKEFFDFVNTLQKIATPTNHPPPGASEIDALFARCAEEVAYNRKTPADSAKEFFDGAIAIRARASR